MNTFSPFFLLQIISFHLFEFNPFQFQCKKQFNEKSRQFTDPPVIKPPAINQSFA